MKKSMKKRNVMIAILAIILLGLMMGCNNHTTIPYQSSYKKITHEYDGYTTHMISIGACPNIQQITVIVDAMEANRYLQQVQIPEKDTLYTYYQRNFFDSKFLVMLYVGEYHEYLQSSIEIDFDEDVNTINLFSCKILGDSDSAICYFLYIIEIDRNKCQNHTFILRKTFTNIEEEE